MGKTVHQFFPLCQQPFFLFDIFFQLTVFVEFLETVAGRLLIDTPEADFELQYELPEQAP